MSEVWLTGIYKITNPKGRVYIGQAIDIVKRFYHYFNFNSRRFAKYNNWNLFRNLLYKLCFDFSPVGDTLALCLLYNKQGVSINWTLYFMSAI